MATTRLIPLHKGGKTLAKALKKSLDYIKNPNKTQGGEWVTAYGCDPLTAVQEFQFSKGEYATITGRSQGKNDVIAYHLRISFKPGEIDTELAGKIAYDLTMKLTKGQNAFVCSVHDDKRHIHAHSIINSTTLDATRKFRNFHNSSFHIRKIADHLCLQNGLSVIENPQPSKGKNYAEWLNNGKPQSARMQLQDIMDEVIPKCVNYDDFICELQGHGVKIKHGKQLSFKLPDAKRFARQDTLGDDYSMTAILERMAGKRKAPKRKKYSPPPVTAAAQISTPTSTHTPNLLIDIQAKLQQGYGAGFEHWATLQNVKEMSKTLLFLKEKGLDSYDALVAKTAAVSSDYHARLNRIKEIESRQKEISELQRYIGNYGKTRDTYRQYQELKKQPLTKLQKLTNATHPADDFYEVNRAAIALHEAAKRHFDSLEIKKLPKVSELKKEYAVLDSEKRKLYSGHKEQREEMQALQMAKHNAEVILNGPRKAAKNRENDLSL